MVAIAQVQSIQSNIAIGDEAQSASADAADVGKSTTPALAVTTDAVTNYVALYGMHSGKAAADTPQATTVDARTELLNEVDQLQKESEELAKKGKDADAANKGGNIGLVAARADAAKKVGHAAEQL